MSFIPTSSFSQSGTHLLVAGVSFSFPGRRVLTDISFTVPAGQRVGLIGENGCGKSTLLKVIAGKLVPDVGTVTVNSSSQAKVLVGLLDQEPAFSLTHSVGEVLEDAVAPIRFAVEQVSLFAEHLAQNPNDLRTLSDYGKALDTVDRLDAWTIDFRIEEILNGLGLAHLSRKQLTGALSGGERVRLSLASLLLSSPDVLLLDEPTNHLDDSAVAFLVGMLALWNGPVLLASHDRAFLDETATRLIDMDPTPVPHSISGTLLQDGSGTGIGVTQFSGTFTDYVFARADVRERWQHQYQAEQSRLAHLRAAAKQQTVGHVDWSPRTEGKAAQKFYADRNAKVVRRRLNDAKGRLAELEATQVRKPPSELTFAGFTVAEVAKQRATSGPALVATEVAVEGRLKPVSLSVGWNERLLITGVNGCGKSTLAEVLAGALEPTRGSVLCVEDVRVGMLSQEVNLDLLTSRDCRRTAAQVYADNIGVECAERIPLGAFGLIAGRDTNMPFGDLSVGTMRRVALAILLARPPDVLILDEPTNHFSLSLVGEIETAIVDYPGTVIVISHDRWLRDRWKGNRLVLT